MGRCVEHRRTGGAGAAPARPEKARGTRPHCRRTRAGPPPLARAAHDAAGAPDHPACFRRPILRVERAFDPPPTRVLLLAQEGVGAPTPTAPSRSKPPAHREAQARRGPTRHLDADLDEFRAVQGRDPHTHHASRIAFTARRGTANVASRPEARARYTSTGSTRPGAPIVMRVSLGPASTAAILATISSVG
jgi:hypothetical protein